MHADAETVTGVDRARVRLVGDPDNELELRLRGAVDAELPLEPDLARWFALWGLPLDGGTGK